MNVLQYIVDIVDGPTQLLVDGELCVVVVPSDEKKSTSITGRLVVKGCGSGKDKDCQKFGFGCGLNTRK